MLSYSARVSFARTGTAHTAINTARSAADTFFNHLLFMFSSPLEQIQKTIDELFGRYIPASPKLKKKPKNLDFWKQTWYNTKRKIRKACLQPQTGGFRQASLVTFSGCSAVGSARGLGPRCRRFESCHSDQNFDRKQSLFSTFGHFLCLFKCFTATFEKSHFYDHIIKYGLKIPLSLFTAAQDLILFVYDIAFS